MKNWEITTGAAHLISKLIVSCHELSLDKKSSVLVCKAVRQGKICEIDFLQADKMGLYDKLIETAVSLRKNVIDQEVVIKYFGSRRHERANLKSLGLNTENNFSIPLLQLLFVHLLMPVKIISADKESLVGEYENEGKKVMLEDILTFKEDKEKMLSGKTSLFHYTALVSTTLDQQIVNYLLKEQKKCKHFMQALDKLNGTRIKIDKFSKSVRQAMCEMEL